MKMKFLLYRSDNSFFIIEIDHAAFCDTVRSFLDYGYIELFHFGSYMLIIDVACKLPQMLKIIDPSLWFLCPGVEYVDPIKDVLIGQFKLKDGKEDIIGLSDDKIDAIINFLDLNPFEFEV